MVFVSVPVKHSNTLGSFVFFFFFSLNWQIEPHIDLKSWFRVDNTESMKTGVSVIRESVLCPPSKHCAPDSCHSGEAQTGGSECRRTSYSTPGGWGVVLR